MKDLHSMTYWQKFGELGADIGKAWMPTPREAADTVTALMRERDELASRLAAEKQASASARAKLDRFLMIVANLADEARHTTAKVATTAKNAG